MFEAKVTDDDLQIVWGEVYAPTLYPDVDNAVMLADTIRQMAYNFLINAQTDRIDTKHDNELNGSYVVESFIARPGDPTFIVGAWVVGIYVPDPDLWSDIKKGEYSGLSVEALVKMRDILVELEIPESVTGLTTESEGHVHKFTVHFDDEGNFTGGVTDEVDGHSHEIVRGTKTEPSLGHVHGFGFVELMPWLIQRSEK